MIGIFKIRRLKESEKHLSQRVEGWDSTENPHPWPTSPAEIQLPHCEQDYALSKCIIHQWVPRSSQDYVIIKMYYSSVSLSCMNRAPLTFKVIIMREEALASPKGMHWSYSLRFYADLCPAPHYFLYSVAFSLKSLGLNPSTCCFFTLILTWNNLIACYFHGCFSD